MSYKIAYKIVRNQNGRKVSLTAMGKVTQYKVNQWTKPLKGCGPLAVFCDKQLAENYAVTCGYENTIEVWKCRIKPSKQHRLYCIYYGIFDCLSLLFTPAGTSLATQVMLLEKIK